MAPVPLRVCFVCLGNICRSPTAEAVLRRRVEEAGLTGLVEVDSAGTGGWHAGADADPRAQRTLRAHGYPLAHRARRFQASWFADRDLVLAMDDDNLATLLGLAPDDAARAKVRLLRSYDPVAVAAGEREVPDPYLGDDDGFEAVLAMVERACDGLLAGIRGRLGR